MVGFFCGSFTIDTNQNECFFLQKKQQNMQLEWKQFFCCCFLFHWKKKKQKSKIVFNFFLRSVFLNVICCCVFNVKKKACWKNVEKNMVQMLKKTCNWYQRNKSKCLLHFNSKSTFFSKHEKTIWMSIFFKCFHSHKNLVITGWCTFWWGKGEILSIGSLGYRLRVFLSNQDSGSQLQL